MTSFRLPKPLGMASDELNHPLMALQTLGGNGFGYAHTLPVTSSAPFQATPSAAHMLQSWQSPVSTRTLTLVRRSSLHPGGHYSTDPALLAAVLEDWLNDPASRQTILEMCESALGRSRGGAALASNGWLGSDLKRQLEDGLRRGELVILISRPRTGGGGGTEEADGKQGAAPAAVAAGAQTQSAPRPAKRRTWIEIELVNDQGKPVPQERYRIELPDGTIQDGILDPQGRARVSDIDPGACKITFPEIDAKEWRAAKQG